MSRWPIRKAYLWQEAPFFRLLLPLVAGIICYDAGWPAAHWNAAVIGVLIGCGVVMVGAALLRERNKTVDAVFGVCLLAGMLALGWSLYFVGSAQNRADWYGRFKDTSNMHLARVLEQPRQRAKTTQYTVAVIGSVDGTQVRPLSGKGLVYVYRSVLPDNIGLGDTLLLPSAWQPIRNSGNPFEFDNVSFQHRKGIDYLQFLAPEQVGIIGKGQNKHTGLAGIHAWCDEQLRTFVKDGATLGLLQAMLLGDEGAFDPELRQAYSQTGVIHIVSISGSHVAVLFLVITGLLFWMKGRKGKWVKYGIGVTIVWLYVLMAGAPPSALRSAIMFTLIAWSITTGFEGQGLNTLMAAAFVLLVGEPAWLFSVGFQLSFGAVLSMLVFYRPIYRLWPQTTLLGRKAWQAVAASISAEILTAPIVVYYFHNFPLLFIVANLLSAVLVGLCAIVGGMAILAFSWVPVVAVGLGRLVSEVVTGFNRCIVWLQGLNPRSFEYLQLSAIELVLIYVLIGGIGKLLLKRRKAGVFVALGSACALMVLLIADRAAVLKQERMVVYNNGRQALVETINGPLHYALLAGNGQEGYNAKAAHTGWGAWEDGGIGATGECASINGRKVLLLSDSTANSWNTEWPVDMVVLCRPLRGLKPEEVLKAFRPKQMILAFKSSDYQLRKWEEGCRNAGVPLHAVAEDGAYILE